MLLILFIVVLQNHFANAYRTWQKISTSIGICILSSFRLRTMSYSKDIFNKCRQLSGTFSRTVEQYSSKPSTMNSLMKDLKFVHIKDHTLFWSWWGITTLPALQNLLQDHSTNFNFVEAFILLDELYDPCLGFFF